jgi:hypothetical protein
MIQNLHSLRKFSAAHNPTRRGFTRAKHILSLVEGAPSSKNPRHVISTEGRNLS